MAWRRAVQAVRDAQAMRSTEAEEQAADPLEQEAASRGCERTAAGPGRPAGVLRAHDLQSASKRSADAGAFRRS